MFFALSGFLITGILVKEFDQSNTINLSTFYLRRARRLLPAVVVLVSVCLVWSYFAPIFPIPRWQAAVAALLYFANWQAIYSSEGLGLLSHCWSLSIEEQFYLTWPVILLLLLKVRVSRRGLFVGLLIAAVILFLYRIWLHVHGAFTSRVYMGTDTHADGLLLGCAVALIPLNMKEQMQQLQRFTVPVACYILPLLFLAAPMNGITGRFAIFLVPLLTATCLPSLTGGNSPLSPALQHSTLVYLGQRSYSLYLWHYPVIQFLAPRLHVPSHLVWLPLIAASLFFAEMSYRFIEQPFLREKLNCPLDVIGDNRVSGIG